MRWEAWGHPDASRVSAIVVSQEPGGKGKGKGQPENLGCLGTRQAWIAHARPLSAWSPTQDMLTLLAHARPLSACSPTQRMLTLLAHARPLALWLSCLPPALNLFLAIAEEKERKSFRKSRTPIHHTLAPNEEFCLNPNGLESHGHISNPSTIS